jgi:glycosyltransferase involved in cell wall biosynthesis
MARRGTRRLAFFLPTLEGGGAERVMVHLVAGFAERGFPVDLILASAEGPNLAFVPSCVRVIDMKRSRVLRVTLPLRAYLRSERPAAMLSALNNANVVAMAAAHMGGARPRIVISIHNTIGKEMEVQTKPRERVMRWLLGRLHHWADGIVAVSEGVADDLARRTPIPRSRIDVIYNPVITPALQEAASAAPPHPWFEDVTQPVVLGVGRLAVQKDFPALVDAFAILRREHKARLVILGEGPERSTIEAVIRRHGLQDCVALPGFVDNPYACMARSAVLALSSRFEGLPTVLIEALAVGTPVVAIDCPSGPREILRDGKFGRLVPPGDTPSLASAIASALTSGRPPVPCDALRPFMPDVVLDQYQEMLEPKGRMTSNDRVA